MTLCGWLDVKIQELTSFEVRRVSLSLFPHAALNYLQGFAAGFLAFVTIKGSASLTRVLGAVCFPGVMMMYSLALEFTSVLLYVHRQRRESVGTIRHGEHRTATSTFTQLLSSVVLALCCFTSTETVRTIRDREPKMATSTFTQLLSSVALEF